MEDAQVPVGLIYCRVKTLEGFLEKMRRKGYTHPAQVTDLAAARVVVLFPTDLEAVDALIHQEFADIRKENTADRLDVREFGYEAMHYLVRLGTRSAGARYDKLRDLECEIQVRTVTQDAWAVMEHHINYKKGDKNPEIERRLSALAGQLSEVEHSFKDILQKRYEIIEDARKDKKLYSYPIGTDSVVAFLKKWFHDNESNSVRSDLLHYMYRQHNESDSVRSYVDDLPKLGIKTIGELAEVMKRSESARTYIHQGLVEASQPFPRWPANELENLIKLLRSQADFEKMYRDPSGTISSIYWKAREIYQSAPSPEA